jgi:NADH-quinone oxidoreductase subunit E
MLSDDEKREIDEEIPNYEVKQAAGIEAMKIVQKHRDGWLSEDAIQDVALYLDMKPDELESIASFYNHFYRKPVGKHIIRVCNSISCWVMGYESIQEHIKQRLGVELGGTTADGNFTYLPAVCLGICDHAPAMMIDEETYVDLDADKVDEILAKYK